MKKRILFVALLVLAFSLTACGKGKTASQMSAEKEEQRKNVVGTDEETGEEYYLLADFENYFECTQVNYIASFGTVTEITKEEEPDMVTYGEQSVKLEIVGNEAAWRKRRPTMRVATTNNGFFDLTTDFTSLSRITFDIYNAQDYEASIRFYVDADAYEGATQLLDIFTNTDYSLNTVKIIDLQPNSWNHVEIPAEDMKKVLYDANGKGYLVYGAEALDEVGGFNIEFDRGEIHEKQEVFYFDNMRAYMKSE